MTEVGTNREWLVIAVYGDPGQTGNPGIWSRIDSYLEEHVNRSVLLEILMQSKIHWRNVEGTSF